MSGPREIPLFPLGTVLFPGGPLPLRIFEARYIDLVRRCLRDGSGFGVVLIRDGVEAGGPALTFDVGTYARIVDFSQQPDGLLGIRASGERRFRILERRRARDGLNVADVGEPYGSLQRHTDDAAWVAGRLAELLPIPSAHKQHCLELDDPLERLRFLRPMFEIRYQ